jgi:adenylate kinase
MNATKENDRAAWLQGPSAVCSPAPQPVDSPWRLVLLGAPGVGKGTQASLLNERIGACHLSTGDVFRAACTRGDCGHSPAIAEAMEYMRRGALVPDSTVWEMVRERSACLHCPGGFILDGFPRTICQAESLYRYMEEEGIALSAVIDYEMPLEEIVARLGGRRICESCQAIFHLDGTDGPLRCDHCGGALYQREDDRPESVTLRMKVYHRSTEPLIEFYKRLGLLISVSASGSPEEIFARTVQALESIHHPG